MAEYSEATEIERNLVRLATDGNFEFASMLLLRESSSLSADAKNKALVASAEYGHPRITNLMIEAGADVHHNKDEALRIASEFGHSEAVSVLLKANADVHACDDDALRFASLNGFTPVVAYLLQAGADANALRAETLDRIKRNGYNVILRLLDEYRTETDLTDQAKYDISHRLGRMR